MDESAVGYGAQATIAEPGADIAAPGDLSPAWIDRDLSWLEFNRRVLGEALDERTPLLERVKFLAIFSSNLDEFFMKRIMRLRPVPGDLRPAGQEHRELLDRVRATISEMLARRPRATRRSGARVWRSTGCTSSPGKT